jgi:hypothetical protein
LSPNKVLKVCLGGGGGGTFFGGSLGGILILID